MNKKWLLIFLIGLLGILALRDRDYYHYEWNDGEYIEVNEDADEEYQGLVASIGGLHLKQGGYQIELSSTSWGSENYFEVVDTSYSEGTKIRDRILYSSVYEKGIAKNTYEFSIPYEAKSVCVRSYQMDGELSISEYQIRSVKPYYSDTWFLAVLWTLIFLVFTRNFKWFVSEKARSFLVVCAVGLFISVPLFSDFLANGHDVLYHLQRIRGIVEGLSIGDQFPIRVNTAFNKGYGQLNPVMYPELFLYIPGVLGMLGVSILISIKFLLILINIATGLIGFYSLKTVTKERTALFFAIIYMMSPYRLNNIYIRFALGEFLAMTFLPLLFIGIYHIVCGDYKKWWMAAAGCCCVLQSHLLTVEMSVLFAAVFVIMNVKFLLDRHRVWAVLKAVGMTLLLNLWYLVPLVQFMGFQFNLVESQRDLSKSGVYLGQMFSMRYSPENDRVIGSTYHDMSLSVGAALLVGLLLYLVYKNVILSRDGKIKKILDPCLVTGILAIYLSSWLFPWQLVYKSQILARAFGIIQFPWRFLIFVTLFLSIITAFVTDWCWDAKKIWTGIIGFCLVCSVVILEDGYIHENQSVMENKYDQTYENFAYSGYYKKGYGTWIPLGRDNIVTLDGEAELVIENYERKDTSLSLDFAIKDGEVSHVMIFPYYNYGFYQVELDGEGAAVFSDEQELVAIEIPAGVNKGHIELGYAERKLYILCDAISLFTILGVFVAAGYSITKKHTANS